MEMASSFRLGGYGNILVSRDGVLWTQGDAGTSVYLYGVDFVNNLFVVTGELGTILTSPDGITWTGRTSGTTMDLYGTAFGNRVFVVVGKSGTILYSDPVF